jgi:NitT/TauT family transport system permease protein
MSVATERGPIHVDEEKLRHDEIDVVRSRQRRSRTFVLSWRVLILVALLGGWYLASGRVLSSLLVSNPVDVARAFWKDITSGALARNARFTVIELAAGYAIGVVLALIASAVLSLSVLLQRITRPFLMAFYAVPKVALAPLMIMWFGLGMKPKIVLAAIFVFFVVFMSTLAGLAAVGTNVVNVARVMGASRWQLMLKVVFPTAIPSTITALRIAIPGAMAGAIIGEFMAGNNGLGYMVQSAASQFSPPGMFAGIGAILVVVLICDSVLTIAERGLLKWRPSNDRDIRQRT